ncbi:hypothetical protein [Leptospira bandrabouensis]|uniref:hypothetical protein n=1 Tax=Leptospira bandrabouensis TaxID=2484903 RepID=UPI001EEC8466|nr:hypothetical protein [Leptospira bandrabouensis]MCG6154029.1 hypothetical protein [Leptospira bandrabouensis]
MNKEIKEAATSALEDLNWVISIPIEKFPTEINSNLLMFKTIANAMKKGYTSILGSEIPNQLIQQLNSVWIGFKEVIDDLKLQANGVPRIAINQLNAKLLTQINATSNTNGSTGNFSIPILISYLNTLSDKLPEIPNIKKATDEYHNLTQQTTQLLDELRKKSGEIGIEKFAEIFGRQSNKQSRFFSITQNEKSRLNLLKLGSAERWLLIGILILVIPLNSILSVPETFSLENLREVIIFIGKKILSLSIWLFLIRFSFRNYSHYTYLAIQNTHRQNVLNSFRLLIEAIPPEDNVARSALMQEVAKNIYIGGKNPFLIDNKKSDTDLQGILEMLKLLKS